MQQINKQPAFELGQIVATPGALAALKKAGQQPGEFLTLHVSREWGDLCDEDRKENDYRPRARFQPLEQLPNKHGRQVVDYHGVRPLCDHYVESDFSRDFLQVSVWERRRVIH